MSNAEKNILDLESRFPALSGVTFSAARKRALAAGQSVLQSDQGCIYEVFPDGTRKLVKRIDPPTAVESGRKIKIG